MKRLNMARKPGFRAKVALILVPSLALIALAEVGTRAFLWARFGKQVPTLNWTFEYEPYLVMKRTGKVHRSYPVGSDQYRVLVLGGSTATQIPDEVFRAAVGAHTDREVVVINLGENGYILNQEKVMLMLRGIPARPDLIISLDGANDFVIASKLHKTGVVYQSGLVSLAVERPFLNAVFAVARHSQFVNALAKLRERRAESAFRGDSELEEAVQEHLIEGWNSISTVARGMEVPYVMVLQPYLHLKSQLAENEKRLAAEYDYRKDFLLRMFRATYQRMSEHSFPGDAHIVDGTALFEGMPAVEIFLDEVHMTEEGNKHLVEGILKAALALGLEIPQRDADKSPEPARAQRELVLAPIVPIGRGPS